MRRRENIYSSIPCLRIGISMLASTSLIVVLSGLPTFTGGDPNEYLDYPQLALHSLVLLVCLSSFLVACCADIMFVIRQDVDSIATPRPRSPRPSSSTLPWVRFGAGVVVAITHLAIAVLVFFRIAQFRRTHDFIPIRCYVQYLTGSMAVLNALLVVLEGTLYFRLCRDHSFLQQIEQEQEALELKEQQRRERAMTVHHYVPNIALHYDFREVLDGHGDLITNGGTAESNDMLQAVQGHGRRRSRRTSFAAVVTAGSASDNEVLPYYQARDTTVGGGVVVDAIAAGASAYGAGLAYASGQDAAAGVEAIRDPTSLQELCPHPYEPLMENVQNQELFIAPRIVVVLPPSYSP